MPEFTRTATTVWRLAAAEAAEGTSSFIEPGHLLASILALPGEAAAGRRGIEREETVLVENALRVHHVSADTIRRSILVRISGGTRSESSPVMHRSDESRAVFDQARKLSAGNPVSSLHLLAALLTSGNSAIEKGLRNAQVERKRLLGAIAYPERRPIGEVRPPSSETVKQAKERKAPHAPSEPEEADPKTDSPAIDADEPGALARFGTDLTEAAQEGRLAPVVGRRDEILHVLRALTRKKKNNPVLVGEAGVGKTAIVEAIAMRIAQGKDNQILAGKKIIELNMGSLLADTSLRGQFERRIKAIVEEASADPDLILFIDEIHTLLASGAGSSGATDMLKPALARGAIKLIGATTTDEYRRYIEKDPALERRFEMILVEEPSRDEAIVILEGVRDSLQSHHGVQFSVGTLEAAVDLSVRFDGDHRLPDKAIDLLDRAAAGVRLAALSMNPILEESSSGLVSELDVANALAARLGLPPDVVLSSLEGESTRRLLDLEEALKRKILGQDSAIEQIARQILQAHVPLSDQRGPLSVMLFLGPSGVGKTESAVQLSKFLFGTAKNLIRFDMSEFQGAHTVAGLIGSPPGYVGHESEGRLTQAIRSHPYSVILLDEVEKAHEKIYDLFLQVFDEGRLTDSKGRLCDARNCIFIMTSNLSGSWQGSGSPRESLKSYFRPEFINRIDEVVEFGPISSENRREILRTLLNKVMDTVKKKYQVEIRIDPKAEDYLLKMNEGAGSGARELNRLIEREVQAPLGRKLIAREIDRGSEWTLGIHDGSLEFLQA